jgi:hypothetical protein
MAHTPKLLDEFNCESKDEDNEKKKVGACFLAYSTLGVKGHARALGWD